jgi:hypothetical protein
MVPTRLIALPIVLAALASPAFAQNLPPLLTPAPPIVTPPPPVAPAPVPSVVTPLPQPSMGVPRNINNGPVISGGGGTVRSTYRGPGGYGAPKKKRPKKTRRPRVSSY